MPRIEGGEDEIRRLSRRIRCALVAAVSLLAAAPAALADQPPPWAGGVAVETPFERYAGQLASVVAGRPVRVICNSSFDWGQLAAQQGLDPITAWGFVVFTPDSATETDRPSDSMQLSEATCWYLDAYWRAPLAEKGKSCVVSTRIVFQERTTTAKVKRRVKIKGRSTTRWVHTTKIEQVPVSVPQFATCPDYRNRVFALQTISHESQHLAGIRDEGAAECNGMQLLPWFAEHFGATAAQAREMAGDYFHDFYEVIRPGTPYYLPTCPDPVGG